MSNSRLHFIDVTRSLAILLMLQGHFISATFVDYSEKAATLRTTGASDNFWFDLWCQFRGFTPPLFFTITGLVFAYLLTRNANGTFWQQKRVRKGLNRGLSIIFWGYALQVSISYYDGYYSKGIMNPRFYSFHVLQCIGLGLITLLLLYWIFTLIKKIPFEAILIVAGVAVFVISPFINSGDAEYFPLHGPAIIQNAFHGTNSIFPIFPWFGFIFLGGAIGVLIHKYQHKLGQKGFTLRITVIGLAACLSAYALIAIVGKQFPSNTYLGRGYWQFSQLAVVILIMGLMMHIQQKWKLKIPFLIAIGQNTLVVYVLHVIVLYGAIIGIGLKTFIGSSLTFGQALFGAILFIFLFGFITKYQPAIIRGFKRLLHWSKKEMTEVA